MIGKSERHSVEFLGWEARGRGFQVWDFPVEPEPLFYPFPGHGVLSDASEPDDGRRPTLFSSLVRRVSERLAPAAKVPEGKGGAERAPEMLAREELVELQASVPESMKLDLAAWADFFRSVRAAREPVAFEIVATGSRIFVQFVIHPGDLRLVRRQLDAFFPAAAFVPVSGDLEALWGDLGGPRARAVEFGLGKEFVIPLVNPRGDPFVGLVGALGEVEEGETAVFQVIFSPVDAPWDESVMRSVTHADGSAYFVNAPELLAGARQKLELPLYAAVVRLAANARSHDRTWEILCDAASALGAYGSARGNELIPLKNDGYPDRAHEEDVVRRQSHRSGMILNASELAGFVHLPSPEVRAPKLRARTRKTKAAPSIAENPLGLLLGTNEHHGVERAVGLSSEQRARHIHVIGASGTGKSTLLFNLIRQDIERGEGVSVIDPHGDLIDRVLGIIPEHRIEDVVLLDPSDEEHIVGFNILSAHSDWEKNMLASDLVSVFRRLSTSWGDQLNSVLHNALLAFMKSDRGGTLLDLRRFLLEPAFRAEILKTVRDANVVYYWQKAFPQLSGNKSVGSVITRLDTFLSPESIRYMVAQRENRIDFGDIMDGGRIFLAKLSQGAIGKDNSHLLGSLLVAKLQSEAMARQRQSESARRFHFAYLDEFHDFLTPSLAESLSGVRKYRLGLVLGHQEMRQVERDADVASALLSNAYTRIVFRVGDKDARTLENGFSDFDAKDIQNLGTGEAVCRIERSAYDFSLSVPLPGGLDAREMEAKRKRVVEASRAKHATARAKIGEALAGVEAEPVREPVRADAGHANPSAKPAPTPEAPKQAPAVEGGGKEPLPLPDLGRGGAQHKAIQDRLKEEAERLGFRVTVEKEILGGAGKVDLVLSRDGTDIACEITVTTTIDHEVGNVSKCIKAGFEKVAVVSGNEDKLRKLSAAVINSLGPEKAGRVVYQTPDDCIEALRAMPQAKAPEEPKAVSRGGRTVRRTVVSLSPSEAKEKEEQALKLMAQLMKRKSKSPG